MLSEEPPPRVDIDQRLEALAQTVRLLASMHKDLKQKHAQLDEQTAAHEQRLDDLEKCA